MSWLTALLRVGQVIEHLSELGRRVGALELRVQDLELQLGVKRGRIRKPPQE